MNWTLTLSRYSGGWSWSTSEEGALWEHSGWAWTRRGAIRAMRRARRSHERSQAKEVWTETAPLSPAGEDT